MNATTALNTSAFIRAVIVGFGLYASAAQASSSQCLAGKQAALMAGHFSGPLVCSHKNASFVFVGRTRGGRFSIYDYRYRFRAAVVMHGGQRVVVFQGNRYIGQYEVVPFVTVSVKGEHVVLKGDEIQERAVLDFSREPPKRVLVNGEEETFGL